MPPTVTNATLRAKRRKREKAIMRICRTTPRQQWVSAIMAATGDDLATTFKAVCLMEQRGDFDELQAAHAQQYFLSKDGKTKYVVSRNFPEEAP